MLMARIRIPYPLLQLQMGINNGVSLDSMTNGVSELSIILRPFLFILFNYGHLDLAER